MILIASSFSLLVIVAGMFLLAKSQKDSLSNFFKYVAYFVIVLGFLQLVVGGAFMCGHMMMRHYAEMNYMKKDHKKGDHDKCMMMSKSCCPMGGMSSCTMGGMSKMGGMDCCEGEGGGKCMHDMQCKGGDGMCTEHGMGNMDGCKDGMKMMMRKDSVIRKK